VSSCRARWGRLSAPDRLGPELDRLLATAQAEQRAPSLSAAVFRGPELLWQRAIGLAEVETPVEATPEHAYRIGSITKTFTAVCVLQLERDGRLELDAPIRVYVPEAPPGPTVRQALSHLTGIQREPPGEIWETMKPPTREELLAGLEDAERVLEAGRHWHYSNLAYGLLGEIVERLADSPYAARLQERVLDPLGLERTQLDPDGPLAKGYFVEPYSHGVRLEPDLDLPETSAAMGQLWSTTGDLARWGAFLAAGHDDVLPKEALDGMARVAVMADAERWTVAWGLGLGLYRRGDRVYAGHGGAMPGFLSMLLVHRASATGAVVLANAGAQVAVDKIALDLVEAAIENAPPIPDAWLPGDGAPDEVAAMLGRWWTEGYELIVSWGDGALRSELVGASAWNRHSTFAPDGDDRWRCVEGRERGELLRVVRDEQGTPVRLYFATYPCTREPSTFG
jgi:CubicO group peptidase (beta-lactamase class C family)